jgi:hypothetical protein
MSRSIGYDPRMTERRSFLTRLAAAAAAFGFGQASAGAQTSAPPAATGDSRFQPAREKLDEWMEQLPGKHRLLFDAVSPTGAQESSLYANNFFTANKSGYGLGDADLAVIICLRHNATAFAFNDAIWAKYSEALSENTKFTDPKTGQAPTTNLRKPSYEALIKRGVHLAICDLSAHRIAGVLARKTEKPADEVYKELVANALGSSHFVPAGIVAVNRAQERGYSLAYVG